MRRQVFNPEQFLYLQSTYMLTQIQTIIWPGLFGFQYPFCFGLEISSFELSNVLYIISVVNPYI